MEERLTLEEVAVIVERASMNCDFPGMRADLLESAAAIRAHIKEDEAREERVSALLERVENTKLDIERYAGNRRQHVKDSLTSALDEWIGNLRGLGYLSRGRAPLLSEEQREALEWCIRDLEELGGQANFRRSVVVRSMLSESRPSEKERT